MTYSVQSVASLADVITKIVDFAIARGWSGGSGTIVHPVTGQSYTLSQATNVLTITAAASTVTAALRLPYLLGTYPASPVVSLPSQVHLFGNNAAYTAPDSQAFIACVVECGYNQYRHIYIGTLVKAGDFTNGDLFSTNNFYEPNGAGAETLSYLDVKNRFLFGAGTSNVRAGGGARITHADNAVTWRDFVMSMSQFVDPEPIWDGTEIYGGNRDGVNDGYVYRGHAEYGAAQILIPVNLYVSKGDLDADWRIIPVGHASGVRLVDMKNLSPGQQISIGSDDWRVFPEFTKSASLTLTKALNAFYAAEGSYNLGFAYRE